MQVNFLLFYILYMPKEQSEGKSKKVANFNATPQEKMLLKQQRDFVERKNKCAKEITKVLEEYGFRIDIATNPVLSLIPKK